MAESEPASRARPIPVARSVRVSVERGTLFAVFPGAEAELT